MFLQRISPKLRATGEILMTKNASTTLMPDQRAWSLRKPFFKVFDPAQTGDYPDKSAVISPATLITLSFIAIVFLLLSACVTLTEEERTERRYELENSLILAKEEFERRKLSCRAAGGMIQITRYSSTKLGGFRAREYKRAQCVK